MSVSFQDVQEAITRCLEAEPPRGPEYGLSRDASLLGGILGSLIYHGENRVDLGRLSQAQLNALARWGSEAVRGKIFDG